MGLFYTVVAGTTELNNPNLTRVGIRQAIVNPNYSYLDYDIAIIKLSEQLEFNDKIQPVKLPENTNSTPRPELMSLFPDGASHGKVAFCRVIFLGK